jgi:site-specific DNA recombinase
MDLNFEEPIPCAVYARYSSVLQRPASIQVQIRRCREFAASNNFVILEDHIYYDEAKSGRSMAPREDFLKLYDLARSGNAPFNYVLVDDTSRVARNAREALEVFEELTFNDVYAFYIMQMIDTRLETAPEMITLHGMTDSLYIRELSKKTHGGIEEQVLKGFSGGGKRYGISSQPVYSGKIDRYGIKEVDGYKLFINPDEADIVKCIFHLFGVREYTAKNIAHLLNRALSDLGEPKPPRSEVWSASTIRGILNNPIYKGRYIWNKTSSKKNPKNGRKKTVLNPREKWRIVIYPDLRIISEELWYKVKDRQEELSYSGGHRDHEKRSYSQHLLTSLAQCGHCGKTFGIVSGGKFAKYGCNNNWNKGLCNIRTKVPRILLEETIVWWISQHIADSASIDIIAKEARDSLIEFLNREAVQSASEELREEMNMVTEKIANICKAIEDGAYAENLNSLLAKHEKRRRELENLLAFSKVPETESDVSSLISKSDIMNYFRNVAAKLIDPKLTKETLDSVVEKIVVYSPSEGVLDICIHERTDVTAAHLVRLVAKKNGSIRLHTLPRFISYTSRVFRTKILLSPRKDDILQSSERVVLAG